MTDPSPTAAGPPADKSVGAALALTFFFGPLGLFYVSVLGAVIAIIVSIIVAFLTLGIGLLLVWPISMVWAAVTASKKHQEFEAWKIGKLAGGTNYGVI